MSGRVGTTRHTSLSGLGTSGRLEAFTEAVPLSLSSMAHDSIPLEEGVLDGLRQILSHTLLSCVNYARIIHAPHEWNFRDIKTSVYAWEPVRGEGAPRDLPFSLERLKFNHHYIRSAYLYLGAGNLPKTREDAKMLENDGWTDHSEILGRVSLHYASTEKLTPGELDGIETEDVPPIILYKAAVQYRSIPATGNQQAVQAEELSMLSFGGSVDDDVKFGALAALYDEVAKYVLEIYSVRGKKYKFDLMDSTLSDGTIPRLPSSCEGDPFVKSLCATVIDHKAVTDESESMDESEQKTKQYPYSLTTMQLTLEGKPRSGKNLDNLPPFDSMMKAVMSSFLLFRPKQPAMATALPSGHTLILEPSLAGRIFVNGRYVTTWGQDRRIGCEGVALFGMDLHSIPFWHGQIVDYEAVKIACGLMWHEIMVDARLSHLNVARRLLHRLMSGSDPVAEEQEEEDESYEEEFDDEDVDQDCLESQVLSSAEYDIVGIAPKALVTRFVLDFGERAYPCQPHEVEWVKKALPGRAPVMAPLRLLKILRRGGIFDVQRTTEEIWFGDTRPANDGKEKEVVAAAISMLQEAECEDIEVESVVFTSFSGVKDSVGRKSVCRYNELENVFSVHEKFFEASVSEYSGEALDSEKETSTKAYLLGMYLAQEHPDGELLPRYMLRNRQPLG